jgi:hypothetical protein
MPIRISDDGKAWQQCGEIEFVDHWTQKPYASANPYEFLYTENIGFRQGRLTELGPRNLELLWLWKVWGMTLNPATFPAALDRSLERQDLVNRARREHPDSSLPDGGDLRDAIEQAATEVSPGEVFARFFRHVAHPLTYPVTDRNTCYVYWWAADRAEAVGAIQSGAQPSPALYDGYAAFYWALVASAGRAFWEVDRALLACGRRLRQQPDLGGVPPWVGP